MNWDCFLKWLDVLLEPIVIFAIGALGLFWGYKIWHKQKKEEGKYLIEQKKFEARIDASKAAWSMLSYFSENDSDLNMIRRGETDENGDKIYYFRHAQAKQFFDALQKIFFTDGHGLFLSKEVKTLLFEMRSQMYGLYHVALKSNETEIKIQNKELVKRVVEIREELIEHLHRFIDS
jgi:hypothetical protein